MPVPHPGLNRAARLNPPARRRCSRRGQARRGDIETPVQNEAETNLVLGINGVQGILFTRDGSPTQRWDIVKNNSDGNYVIYSAGTSNILVRDSSCSSNGNTYMYCTKIVTDPGRGRPLTDEWSGSRGPAVCLRAVGAWWSVGCHPLARARAVVGGRQPQTA